MEINMLENERQRKTARIYGDLAQFCRISLKNGK
jgi:hypothetical protein